MTWASGKGTEGDKKNPIISGFFGTTRPFKRNKLPSSSGQQQEVAELPGRPLGQHTVGGMDRRAQGARGCLPALSGASGSRSSRPFLFVSQSLSLKCSMTFKSKKVIQAALENEPLSPCWTCSVSMLQGTHSLRWPCDVPWWNHRFSVCRTENKSRQLIDQQRGELFWL